jgi:hypothetical protein
LCNPHFYPFAEKINSWLRVRDHKF